MPDAPGSGALNAGYAVTYGDLGETNRMNLVNLLDRQNEERQQRLYERQKADEAHKFALQKYYGSEFDPKNYASLTDIDKRLPDMADGLYKKVSDLIFKGASDQDIDRVANQGVASLRNMYQIGTALKRNIDASAEGLKGDPGIDLGALNLHSNLMAFYKKDPNTGQLIPKTNEEVAQLNPQYNYAADILKNHPNWVSKGKGVVDWNGMQKLFMPKTQELSGEHYTSPGVKSKNDFKATWLDGLQDLTKDDKGVYHVTTVSDPIITKDANGNEVKIGALPESTINTMQSTPGAKANMDVATMKYLAQHNLSAEPGTQAFEDTKRIMGYQMMKDFAAKSISDKSSVNKSASLIRMELGYPMPGSGQKALTPEEQKAAITASFNDITGVRFIGNNGAEGRIENGKLVGFKGGIKNLFNGGVVEGKVPIEQLPLSLIRGVEAYAPNVSLTGKKYTDEAKEAGYDPQKQMQADADKGMVDVKVKNGVVVGIRTDNGPYFSVDDKVQSQINIDNKLRSIKNKIQPKKNDNSYYNDPGNVSNNSGGKITYKDGTVWQISGGKLKQIK